MRTLNDYLHGHYDIPLKTAADFFIGVRTPVFSKEKTASMLDAPDESGELEGSFTVPNEHVASLIHVVITKAVALQQAASIYEPCFQGRRDRPADVYAYNSLVSSMSKRAVALAGGIHLGDIDPPPATTDSQAAVSALLRGEQELIQALRAVEAVCGDNPFRFTVAQQASLSQQRMDDLRQSLSPTSPVFPQVDLGEDEFVEDEEVPEEQSVEPSEAKESSGLVAVLAAAMRKAASANLASLAEAPVTMSSPAGSQQLEPTNYLAAEMRGRQAQEVGESAFYREQLRNIAGEAQTLSQQVAMAQEQAQQLEQQANEASMQVQEANQQAVAAHDEALRQTQIAANMRMGMQQLRAQLLEVASQDPAAAAAQEFQGIPSGGQQPMAAEDPALAAGEGGAPLAPQQQGSMKVGSLRAPLMRALPGAALGAAAGYGFHKALQHNRPELEQRVQELEQRPASFMNALRVAGAQSALFQAQRAEEHPTGSAAFNIARGALVGGSTMPSIVDNIKVIAGR